MLAVIVLVVLEAPFNNVSKNFCPMWQTVMVMSAKHTLISQKPEIVSLVLNGKTSEKQKCQPSSSCMFNANNILTCVKSVPTPMEINWNNRKQTWKGLIRQNGFRTTWERLSCHKVFKITQVQTKVSFCYLNPLLQVEFRAIFEPFSYILLNDSKRNAILSRKLM